MKVGEYGGYEFHIPTSGGKASKGCAVTGSVQVRKDGVILKQFRFSMANEKSRRTAADNARSFVVKALRNAAEEG